MEAFCWERLTVGETGSYSDGWGHAQSILCPIFCWWAGLCSLPVVWPETKLWWPKGNQSWIFTERTDAKAEIPILWPPDTKKWLLGKDPDAGKDLRQEEKGTTDDEMVGWHHRLNGHEFEQAAGVGDGQGSLMCCSPRGCKELDTTEQLNWTEVR